MNKLTKKQKIISIILADRSDEIIQRTQFIIDRYPNFIKNDDVWLTGSSIGYIFGKSHHWAGDRASYQKDIFGKFGKHNLRWEKVKLTGNYKQIWGNRSAILFNLDDILNYLDTRYSFHTNNGSTNKFTDWYSELLI